MEGREDVVFSEFIQTHSIRCRLSAIISECAWETDEGSNVSDERARDM